MSPDPTPEVDGLDRLARVAPTVDLDEAAAAFGAVRRRRRRRRRRAVAGAGALAAVLAVGALASMRSSDGAAVDVVAGPATDGPGAAELGGLRLELQGPDRAVVGERIRAVVTLTNTTDEPIRAAQVAGCDDQVGAAVRAVGSDAAVGRAYLLEGHTDDEGDPTEEGGFFDPALGPAVAWDGDAASLPAALSEATEPDVWRAAEPGVCLMAYVPPAEIAPGASVRQEIPIDLRWGKEAPSGEYELIAVGGGPVDASGMAVDGSWPAPEIQVVHPIEIVDDPAREPAAAAALDALPSTPTLDEWIAETADLDAVPGFRQRWFASHTWWRGAWETWIDPMAGNGHQADPLRIRFDPARGEIVDVRTVFWGGTPSDDPDAEPSPPGEPLDAIRYQAP